MNKVIRITESDLTRIVKRVLNENVIDYPFPNRKTISIINNEGKNVDVDCELAQTPEEKKQGLHKWGSDSRNHKSSTRTKEYSTRG
jgi:hypothetical protein